MAIDLSVLSQVLVYQFPNQVRIDLNLDPALVWADRFNHWEVPGVSVPPTEAETEVFQAEFLASEGQIRERRKPAYIAEMGDVPGQTDPIETIGDQFDSIYGFFETQRTTPGAPLEQAINDDPEMVRLLDKRLEIKARP